MVTDEESLSAWTRFLTEYANGVFNSPTHPPVLTDDLQAILNREPSSSKVEEETAVYKSGEIDQDTAARVRRFYCERKFLPPPRSSRESVRLRVLAEYDISGPEQMTNLQDSVELLAAFFPGVLCTFSLFKGDEQYHYAVSGPNWIKEKYNVYVGVRIPSEDSLCGHAVLAKGGATACQVLEGDWRYIQNPFKVAGFKTYASTVVNLPLDPSAVSEDGEQVGIGTLNLCFVDNAPAELTETQKNVTIQITRNLAKQLRATWDGHRRTKVANIQRGLSEYIREALVLEGIDSPDMSRMGHKPAMNGHVSIVKSNSKSTTGKATARMDLRSMAQDACTRISEVLPRITALQIIDLRSISLIVSSNGVLQNSSFQLTRFDLYAILQTDRRDEKAFVEDPDSFFPIQIIATSLNSVDRGRDGTTTAMIKQSILDYLQTTLTTNPTVQDVSMLRQTGFEAILPPDTRNFLAIPFFSADCSIFMIIASVDRDVSRLDESDQIAIDMFGSILRARAVQADLMTLDKAKTAFLSSISHELRTPMHGVLTGLELLRGAMETGNTEQAEMLIEVAETSGKMLQGLLNDVLDFGSLKGSENRQSKVDLAATAVATAKTCALRMDQSPATVAMSVEYEDRPWEVMIDEAGYQR
jgi:signal transduction histidine kinase